MKVSKPASMLSTRRLGAVIASGEISVFVTGHIVDFVSLEVFVTLRDIGDINSLNLQSTAHLEKKDS